MKLAIEITLLLSLAAPPLFAQGRIPPECWLDQRDSTINSCKYCHTSGLAGAGNDDIDRQGAFPSQENLFLNLLDPNRLDLLIPPETIPADLTEFLAFDNYRLALEARGGTAEVGSGQGEYKYFPDLDPEQTGPNGFANNGWRAFKWKPFELAWPRYNGRIQRNWVRLPDRFQRDATGAYDLEIYRQNLDLMVAAVRGELANGSYRGMADDEEIVAYQFPTGVEVLHYLYYLDPSRPDMKATRIKEVRWRDERPPCGDLLVPELPQPLQQRYRDPLRSARCGVYNSGCLRSKRPAHSHPGERLAWGRSARRPLGRPRSKRTTGRHRALFLSPVPGKTDAPPQDAPASLTPHYGA